MKNSALKTKGLPKLVTALDLSQYLKVSESTVYKLAYSGELPGFKIGDSWRFDMADINRAIRRAKGKRKKKWNPEANKEGMKQERKIMR